MALTQRSLVGGTGATSRSRGSPWGQCALGAQYHLGLVRDAALARRLDCGFCQPLVWLASPRIWVVRTPKRSPLCPGICP